MKKELWINLPVRDLNRSREFFKQLGFAFNEGFVNNDMACMYAGDSKVVVMLCTEPMFKGFISSDIATQGSEVLFSLDAASREEVDDMASKAEAAGGTVYDKPGDSQGWLYGCGFTDLDGHRWNILYRDMEKMPR